MNQRIASLCLALVTLSLSAYGQATLTIYNPIRERPEVPSISPAVKAAVETASAAASKSIPKDTCEREIEIAGSATGAFTKAGAKQTLALYQYCQTGNGFGWVGLVLIDGDKVVGNYISEAGWTTDIVTVSDVNINGLDEFALAYSGGMHQGQGGTGVDIFEFAEGGAPRAIGWYKAEEYGPTEDSTAWILTAKPGTIPAFYTQKHFSTGNNKYKAVGRAVTAKLGKAISKFTAVK